MGWKYILGYMLSIRKFAEKIYLRINSKISMGHSTPNQPLLTLTPFDLAESLPSFSTLSKTSLIIFSNFFTQPKKSSEFFKKTAFLFLNCHNFFKNWLIRTFFFSKFLLLNVLFEKKYKKIIQSYLHRYFKNFKKKLRIF
ncbi:hypothetical protein CcBV_33.5 [Bracoviriform congregatae]|uniref:Uncharacterized protein n=2 Tax=root TaxID=1 RepID=S6CVN1_COTCN|nr:hypothetical protein CcBV_33.5 [Bracoviriform congregatae]CAG18169.1 hypothetical protein CcBV_33.5 [Bracoviriform congregatae]CCQ71148.1 hypothetical protein BV26-1 [Cotesia congregata]